MSKIIIFCIYKTSVKLLIYICIQIINSRQQVELYWTSLTNPYLAIRGGPCRPEHKIAGGAPISKKIFSAIRASAWSENKAGGEGVALPGSSPESTPGHYQVIVTIRYMLPRRFQSQNYIVTLLDYCNHRYMLPRRFQSYRRIIL